jgi:hypothetical protein
MLDPRAGPRHDTGAIADREAHCWCRQLPFRISTDDMTEAKKEPIVFAEPDARHPSQPASGSPALRADRARAAFGQSMGLVALTVGCLALGAYMRRDLTGGAGIALSVGAVICLVGLNSARPTGAITRDHAALRAWPAGRDRPPRATPGTLGSA